MYFSSLYQCYYPLWTFTVITKPLYITRDISSALCSHLYFIQYTHVRVRIEKIERGLARLKNVDSLKLSDLGFSKVTIKILILRNLVLCTLAASSFPLVSLISAIPLSLFSLAFLPAHTIFSLFIPFTTLEVMVFFFRILRILSNQLSTQPNCHDWIKLSIIGELVNRIYFNNFENNQEYEGKRSLSGRHVTEQYKRYE